MNDILGYQGKKVVITGAATGMGNAAAQLLIELGAEVYALDIAEVNIDVHKVIRTDMKSQSSIDAALAELPASIDALFNCAGVPSPPFSFEDTVLINFVGLRYLTDALQARLVDGSGIASIASTAGMGWRSNIELVNEFLALDNGFDVATAWLEKNKQRVGDPYGFSKQCLIVYTMSNAKPLAAREIRINCIAPSPTASPFMDKLKGEGKMPAEAIELFLPSIGRYATGAEMGEPLVLLNSKLASFVSGQNLPVDFGYAAEVFVGQRENLMNIS